MGDLSPLWLWKAGGFQADKEISGLICRAHRKRERRFRAFSDSVMYSRGHAALTRDEDDGSCASCYWSKSYGWSRSRTIREKNIKQSRSKGEFWSLIIHPIEFIDRKDRLGIGTAL